MALTTFDADGNPVGNGILGNLLAGESGGGGDASGLLGNLGQKFGDNSNFFAMLGAGLMGAPRQNPFQNAMQAASTGSQLDLRAQAEMLRRKQDAAKRAAYQGWAAKNDQDPAVAAADPDTMAALYKSYNAPTENKFVVGPNSEIISINPDKNTASIIAQPDHPETMALKKAGANDAQIAQYWRQKAQGAPSAVDVKDGRGNSRTMFMQPPSVFGGAPAPAAPPAGPGAATPAPAAPAAPAAIPGVPSEVGGYKLTPADNTPPSNPYAAGKMNQGESNSATYADRMASAHKVITQNEGINEGVKGWAGGTLNNTFPDSGITNLVNSPERQESVQAQRNFVNAILRKESGAAINKSEFENARKQYFPQPGDTPEVIAQKRQNRELAVIGNMRASGDNYTPPEDWRGGKAPKYDPAKPAVREGATASNPKTGERLIFKGGQWQPAQ